MRADSFMGVSGIEPIESDNLSMQYPGRKSNFNQFDNTSGH